MDLQGHLYVLAFSGTNFVLERDPVGTGASVKRWEDTFWMGKIWIARKRVDERYGERLLEGEVSDSKQW